MICARFANDKIRPTIVFIKMASDEEGKIELSATEKELQKKIETENEANEEKSISNVAKILTTILIVFSILLFLIFVIAVLATIKQGLFSSPTKIPSDTLGHWPLGHLPLRKFALQEICPPEKLHIEKLLTKEIS